MLCLGEERTQTQSGHVQYEAFPSVVSASLTDNVFKQRWTREGLRESRTVVREAALKAFSLVLDSPCITDKWRIGV